VLARSTMLRHKSGTALKTPLLIPSFSSKGLRRTFSRKGLRRNKDGKSELGKVFRNSASILTEAMLVSAYDIYYGHLPKPNRFPATPTLTIIDSGGYETGSDYDLSAVYQYGHVAREWTLPKLHTVLRDWPPHVDAAFVSFDKGSVGKSLKSQVDGARRLFDLYPNQLHNFLIKPSRRSAHRIGNMLNEIRGGAGALAQFHMIGVTEKDLGNSPLDRMATVARLRMILDEAGVASPIQIFGALDPVSSPLYFVAGAEIFDGLTWLRFAYVDNRCVYHQNYAILRVGIDPHDDFARAKMLSDNYAALRDLQLAMQRFAVDHDFGHFGPHAASLRRAAESLGALEKGAV
jgi:hypothetical protein